MIKVRRLKRKERVKLKREWTGSREDYGRGERLPTVQTHPKGGWRERKGKVLLGTHAVNTLFCHLSTALKNTRS